VTLNFQDGEEMKEAINEPRPKKREGKNGTVHFSPVRGQGNILYHTDNDREK
jgi:hypothetical protein